MQYVWFKKFYKGDKCLEDECSSWASEVDNKRLRANIKADPLKTTWQVAEELNIDHSAVIWHLRQIGKVKKFGNWVPHEVTKNPKNHCFEVLSSLLLLLCTTVTHFLIRLWLVTRSGFYVVVQPAQWLNWEETLKHFPKPDLHQKWPWSLSGGVSSTPAFWIPVKPLYLQSMLSKLVRCTENCSTCSWLWSTERTPFFSTATTDCTLYNQHFKSWLNSLRSFASFSIFA